MFFAPYAPLLMRTTEPSDPTLLYNWSFNASYSKDFLRIFYAFFKGKRMGWIMYFSRKKIALIKVILFLLCKIPHLLFEIPHRNFRFAYFGLCFIFLLSCIIHMELIGYIGIKNHIYLNCLRHIFCSAWTEVVSYFFFKSARNPIYDNPAGISKKSWRRHFKVQKRFSSSESFAFPQNCWREFSFGRTSVGKKSLLKQLLDSSYWGRDYESF